MRYLPLLFALLVWPTTARAEHEFPPLFPFVISHDAPNNITNIADWNHAPAGKYGFIHAKDGSFHHEQGRFRIWGTNLCFSANFPEKEQSEKLAARLARLGFNCVRLHHMDSRDIWGDNPETLTTIDPAQLDRLDYLIYKLKLHGIYVNINLHVSRKLDDRDGFPHAAERPDYDKGLNNFYPPFIELQKKFARDLLTHVNPYTQTAYFEEPAVAMIEISNENSVVEQWAAGRNSKLMTMPEPYITEFQKQWNDFLQRKYGTDEALRAAWQFHNEPLGNEMLPCNIEAANTEAERWYAETDEVSISRKLALANGVFRFEIDRMGREPWRPQLISRPHAFEKGKPYTFSIQARADMPGEVSIGPRKDEDDYGNLGFAGTLPLTTDWQTFTFTFIPKESSQRARFDIGNLAENFTYEFRNSSLKPGGTIGLPESITLADGAIPLINRDGLTVPIDPAGQPLALPNEARDDFCEFLFEIERTYWLGMYRFLKDDLQVRQPVSGTQLYYGSTTIQAQLDYVDVHAYWNHPHFPGRPWDMNDWTVSNRALVNELDREIFPRLATARPFGKPYTVSEFDVPFPNQYAAEALPMLAAFGRFQDWDGIFHFAYSHNRNALESRRITGFFDMVGHTAKLVHLPACVAMFVRGDVGTGESLALGTFNPATELELFQRQLGPWNFNFGGIGLDPRLALFHRTALDVSGNHTVQQQIPGVPAAIRRFGRGFSWFPGNTALGRPDRGVAITTENTKVFTGFNGSRMGLGLSDVTLLVGETRLNWATISMVSMNGNGFDPAKSQGKPIRILVAATGLVENSDMELEHLDAVRITYGNRIGSEPVLCEGIPFELRFLRAESICVYPLDESGNRRERIQVEGNRVELGPEYQTVWYEIEVR